MQISINLNNIKDNVSETKKGQGVCSKIKTSICQASIWNCFLVLIIFALVLFILYICKSYTSTVLIWLERQDTIIVYVVVVILFTIVSFPISVGYIVIVIATGYLFGVAVGLILSVVGANLGLIIAHNVLRIIGYHNSVRTLISNDTAVAIIKVISGPSCFKIVFCARLTPIPFGLQNAIFALSNVNGKTYHLASLLGLLPGQTVGVYVGASLRSMQDVLDDQHISPFTYLFAVVQLIFAIGLLIWIGSMARRELAKAIAEVDGKFYISDNKTAYNIV